MTTSGLARHLRRLRDAVSDGSRQRTPSAAIRHRGGHVIAWNFRLGMLREARGRRLQTAALVASARKCIATLLGGRIVHRIAS